MTLALSRRYGRPWWMTTFGREPFGDIFFDRLLPERKESAEEVVNPSVDFNEKDGKFYLTAELPGMKKEEITIKIEDNDVTLSGKKENHREEKNADYYLKETSYGSFRRTFRLPGKIDENKVDATYKDGILTVVLPHEEKAETKKIEVH